MSWDVVLIRTKENNELSLDKIEADNIVPFKQTEIADEIKKIAAILQVRYDCEHPEWQEIGNDEWNIEFNVGECEENETVMLHIRGKEEPEEVLKMLGIDLGTRLVDCFTGDFLEIDIKSGFEAWKNYCDKIINV